MTRLVNVANFYCESYIAGLPNLEPLVLGQLMPQRWVILAVLFLARATMAFQFQSVAALAPLLSKEVGITLADLGILMGLYLAPGMALALPGGMIGQKMGDRRAVLLGFSLMVAGSLVMTVSESWTGQITGRLVAGSGGVLLNVLLTKMVADWFVGFEIATAMAIFANAWPIGIAVSLMILPTVGARLGVDAAFTAVTMLVIIGMASFLLYYRLPDNRPKETTTAAKPSRMALIAVGVAGTIWCLFNVGFTTIFAFGPSMLVERGWPLVAAGNMTSMVLWLGALSVPLGGFIADRSKRHDTFLAVSCLAFALLMVWVARITSIVPGFIALGIVCGLPAGVIMSLPARVLDPAARALGMGVFYMVYYGGMMLGSALAGGYATSVGSAKGAFDFGAAALLLCPLLLWGFHHATKRAI
jgi:predicted MFS family arabinose efflux permease